MSFRVAIAVAAVCLVVSMLGSTFDSREVYPRRPLGINIKTGNVSSFGGPDVILCSEPPCFRCPGNVIAWFLEPIMSIKWDIMQSYGRQWPSV